MICSSLRLNFLSIKILFALKIFKDASEILSAIKTLKLLFVLIEPIDCADMLGL